MRKLIRSVALVIALAIGLMVIPATAALASPSSHASCVAHESEGISPVGSSDEFPGGRPELNQVVRSLVGANGIGPVVSFVAKLHEGSHEACDEATG